MATVTISILAMAPPSGAQVYRLQPGVRSPMYKDYGTGGGCLYTVWYGTFGTSFFAKIRYYGGPCSGTINSINISEHDDVNPVQSPYSYSSGTDSCGAYIEQQVSASAGGNTLWGEDVLFIGSSGNSRSVKRNATPSQDVYRDC